MRLRLRALVHVAIWTRARGSDDGSGSKLQLHRRCTLNILTYGAIRVTARYVDVFVIGSYRTILCEVCVFLTLFLQYFNTYSSYYSEHLSQRTSHYNTRKSTYQHHLIQSTRSREELISTAPATHPRQKIASPAPQQTGSIPVSVSLLIHSCLLGSVQGIINVFYRLVYSSFTGIYLRVFITNRPYSISMVPGGLLVTAMC